MFFFFFATENAAYSSTAAYLVSPCSSAPFRWGRRSCLGLRTGVSPHFSMNSMREILALRGGYERGRVPLPSPMPPESGAPPHNTHPSMVPPRHSRAALAYPLLCFHLHYLSLSLSFFFPLTRTLPRIVALSSRCCSRSFFCLFQRTRPLSRTPLRYITRTLSSSNITVSRLHRDHFRDDHF